MGTSTLIVLAIIVVVALWVVAIYNGLVSMRQRVNQAFADIDVQLRQRHDLIPNLVETVKGYAAHERGTLDEVVKARNAAVAAQGPAQQAAAQDPLAGAIIGGAVGGIIGGAVGRGTGAAVTGAVIGAAAGAAIASEGQRRASGYYWWHNGCYYRYPNGSWLQVAPGYCG